MVFACYFTRFFMAASWCSNVFPFFAHVSPLMKCNILVPIHFDKSRYIEHKVFIHTYIHMFIKNNIEDMCQQLLFPSQRTMAAERNALPKCCRYLLLMMWSFEQMLPSISFYAILVFQFPTGCAN